MIGLKNILVTRPQPDANLLRAELENIGCKVIVEPMINIKTFADVALDIREFDALIVTSKNAVRALENYMQNKYRNIAIFTVGSGTAELAKSLGYSNILNASGDVCSLELFIKQPEFSKYNKIAYLRGKTISKSILLKDKVLKEFIVYDAIPVTDLSPSLIKALDEYRISSALFFSLRTAETFVSLIDKLERTHVLNQINALCISNKLLSCIDDSQWRDVRVAKWPNTECMLQLL